MLYINETSSEVMHGESQQFRNISRLVKKLGYKPIGAQTSTLSFDVSAQNLDKGFYVIPRYSYIDIGSNTWYSTNEDIVFVKTVSGNNEYLSDVSTDKLLFQGQFVEHPPLTALGIANELQYLSVDDTTVVDHFNIRVYVKDVNTQKWSAWKQVDNLYLQTGTDSSYELRLNHNKRYELLFGDGINGAQLNAGDTIAIYYLKSKSADGQAAVGAINNRSMIAFDTLQLRQIIADTEATNQFVRLNTRQLKNSLVFANTVGSTYFSVGDTVEDIRKKAPATFVSQYTLTHENDFAAYARSVFANLLHSVHVCNNQTYLDTYIKYLYDAGLTRPDLASRPLYNQLHFSTTCNFNNVYIIAVPKAINIKSKQTWFLPAALKQLIKSSMEQTKVATCDITFADPIYMLFDVAVAATAPPSLNDVGNSSIVIVQSDKSIRNAAAVKGQVSQIINDYFATSNSTLGANIDSKQLTSLVSNIEDVVQVYTINNVTQVRQDGIALVTWNAQLPTSVSQITSNLQLGNFQYPLWNGADTINDRISVVRSVDNYATFNL